MNSRIRSLTLSIAVFYATASQPRCSLNEACHRSRYLSPFPCSGSSCSGPAATHERLLTLSSRHIRSFLPLSSQLKNWMKQRRYCELLGRYA